MIRGFLNVFPSYKTDPSFCLATSKERMRGESKVSGDTKRRGRKGTEPLSSRGKDLLLISTHVDFFNLWQLVITHPYSTIKLFTNFADFTLLPLSTIFFKKTTLLNLFFGFFYFHYLILIRHYLCCWLLYRYCLIIFLLFLISIL